MDATRVLRLALWPAALAAGGLTAALVLTGETAESPTLLATLGLVIGLSWCITGLEQWRRRPANRIGPLMVLLGFAWFGRLLEYADSSTLFTASLFLKAFYIAVFAHILLAFPSGRLEGRLRRAIVVLAYVDTIVLCAAAALVTAPGCDCVDNLVLVEAKDGLADTLGDVASGVGVALTVVSLGVLVRSWLRATPPRRRVMGPVLWSGSAAAAIGGVTMLREAIGEPPDLDPLWIAYLVVLAAVPFAFKLGFLRDRLARGAVAGLVVELGDARAPGELRDALARALGDPALALGYWLPEQGRYVDPAGRPFDLPPPGDGRVATLVESDGRRVGAIVHDASLADQRELVDGVCAAARLALANERLQAELRARLAELRASRARIVEAADAERKRIERNLHDATQQRLVSVSMSLGLAESRLATDPEAARAIIQEARLGVGAALRELREISQGIHPGILSERGLGPALEELALGAPLPVQVALALGERLPEPVEAAAYYVVAEALANVAKHARASGATVRVARRNGSALVEVADDGVGGADSSRGSGLRGLGDRVEALGGVLAVESPRFAGTRIRAEIPCAS